MLLVGDHDPGVGLGIGPQVDLPGLVRAQVPVDTVEARLPRQVLESGDLLALPGQDLQGQIRLLVELGREVVVERRPVLRVLSRRRHVGHGHALGDGAEAPRLPGRQEDRVVAGQPFPHLSQRRQIVQDPVPAAVGGDDEVAEALLDREPVDGGVGKVRAQLVPRVPVVEGDPDGVFGTDVQEAGASGILPDDVGVAEGGPGDVPVDPLPARPVVPGPEDIRVGVAELVAIDRQVGGPGLVTGGLDVGDRSPGRDTLRQHGGPVGPGRPPVPGELDLAVVGADPDLSLCQGREGQGEDRRPHRRARVVEGQPAGTTHELGIGGGQVGAHDLPALTAARGAVDDVGADVDLLVIVRRDRDGERPLEAVFHVLGAADLQGLGPDRDVPAVARREVVAVQETVVAARPDDVLFHGVGDREARLAPADLVPGPHRDLAAGPGVRRTAEGGTVLAIPVHPVGDPVVEVHVVHLGDRELGPIPGLAAVDRDRHAPVVADDHPLGILRVDPHVVVIPAGLGLRRDVGDSGVQGDALARAQEVQLVGVGRRGEHAGVVEGAADEVEVGADVGPGGTPVVGAPQHAGEGIGGRELGVRARLDQGVDTLGIVGGEGEADLAPGGVRESLSLEALPGRAAVE